MISSRSGNVSDETKRDRKVAYGRLQSEYLVLEQELRKKRRSHEAVVAEIRKLKQEISRSELLLRDKTSDEAKQSRDLGIMEAECSRVKRRMNMMA
jgi:hypothetical protein